MQKFQIQGRGNHNRLKLKQLFRAGRNLCGGPWDLVPRNSGKQPAPLVNISEPCTFIDGYMYLKIAKCTNKQVQSQAGGHLALDPFPLKNNKKRKYVHQEGTAVDLVETVLLSFPFFFCFCFFYIFDSH